MSKADDFIQESRYDLIEICKIVSDTTLSAKMKEKADKLIESLNNITETLTQDYVDYMGMEDPFSQVDWQFP